MSEFKRTMVALDLSKADEYLIKYSNFFAQIFHSTSMYFVHIIPDMTQPKNISTEFHKLFSPEYPVDEKVKNKLELDIQDILGLQAPFDWNVEIIEGKPYEKLIHWVNVKVIDLLTVGHKRRSEGSGITARRVARKSKTNVLFVPDQTSTQLDKIVVPIDFSINSYRALRKALEIKKSMPEVEVTALNIISRPPSDYYSRSFQSGELMTILGKEAQDKFKYFTENYGLPKSKINPVFIDNMGTGVSKRLAKYLYENPTDLVIIGAKGHSPFETFLYGSVTETFVESYFDSPVLVVR